MFNRKLYLAERGGTFRVTMAYCTGMRRGEIVSLRWENVDLLNRLVRLNAGEIKNGIALGDELLESLK